MINSVELIGIDFEKNWINTEWIGINSDLIGIDLELSGIKFGKN